MVLPCLWRFKLHWKIEKRFNCGENKILRKIYGRKLNEKGEDGWPMRRGRNFPLRRWTQFMDQWIKLDGHVDATDNDRAKWSRGFRLGVDKIRR